MFQSMEPFAVVGGDDRVQPGDIPIERGKLGPERPDVLTVSLQRPLNYLQVISDLSAEVLQVAPSLLMTGFDSLDRGTVLRAYLFEDDQHGTARGG